MGPLSGKQQREFIALSMKEKREQEKLQREEARKDQLHAVKLSGEAAKVQQGLIHKDDTHSAKMDELGGKATEAAPKVVGPLMAASGSENVQGNTAAKTVFQPQGTDTVPAMLTPGEAIIPRESAQDPANKPLIESLVAQGRNRKQNVVAMRDTSSGYLSSGTTSVEQKGTVPTSTMSKAPVGWGLVEAALKALKGSNTRVEEGEKKALGYADGSTSVPPMGSGLLEGARKAITTRKDRLQEEEDKVMGTKYYEEGTAIVSPEEVQVVSTPVIPQPTVVQPSVVPPVAEVPAAPSNTFQIEKPPALPNQPNQPTKEQYDPATNPMYYQRVQDHESRSQSTIVNEKGTASGLFQITSGTYKNMQDKWPEKFGNTPFQSKEFFDNKYQGLMAGTLTKDNTDIMRRQGIDVTDGNTYGFHHLGVPDGLKVYKAPDGAQIGTLLSGKVIKDNNYDPRMTVADFKQKMNAIMDGEVSPQASIPGGGFASNGGGAAFGNPNITRQGVKAKATQVPTISETTPAMAAKVSTVPKQVEPLKPLEEVVFAKNPDIAAKVDPVEWKSESYGSQGAIDNAVAAWNATPSAGREKSELGLAGTLKEIFSGFKSLSGLNEQDLTRFAMNYAGSVISGRKPGRALQYAGGTAMKDSMNRIVADARYENQKGLQKNSIEQQNVALGARDWIATERALQKDGYDMAKIQKYKETRNWADLGEPRDIRQKTGEVVHYTFKSGPNAGKEIPFQKVKTRNGEDLIAPNGQSLADLQMKGGGLEPFKDYEKRKSEGITHLANFSKDVEGSAKDAYVAHLGPTDKNQEKHKMAIRPDQIGQEAAAYLKSRGFEIDSPDMQLAAKGITNVAMNSYLSAINTGDGKNISFQPFMAKAILIGQTGVPSSAFDIGNKQMPAAKIKELIDKADRNPIVKEAATKAEKLEKQSKVIEDLWMRYNADKKKPLGSESESGFYQYAMKNMK